MKQFRVGAASDIFESKGQPDQRRVLIPVLGELQQPQPVPPLVRPNLDATDIRARVEARANLLIQRLAEGHKISFPFRDIAVRALVAPKLADLAAKEIDDALPA